VKSCQKKYEKLKDGTFKSYYEWATAKVWVDNVRNYKGINKKKKQFYIMTWHGQIGIKKIEREVENKLSKEYVRQAKYDGIIMNLITVNNEVMYKTVKENFWYNGEILKIGVPSNFILQNTPLEIINQVYNFFKIPFNKKIILYCPSFRDNGDVSVYKFNYELVIKVFNEIYDDDFIMIIKLHPNVDYRKINFINYNDQVINAEKYSDTNEILACSTICISDYSGLMFDAAEYNKKVFIYAPDMDTYTKNRGFVYNFEDLPFSVAKTENELINNIKKFDENTYYNKCKSFFNKIGLVEKDTSLEYIKERILKEIGEKK